MSSQFFRRAGLLTAAVILIGYAMPQGAFAAGAQGVAPPVMIAPGVGTPRWTIAVPVQLTSIPSRYPHFSVWCTVLAGEGQVFPPPVIASGKQDWSLDPNGAYNGTITVRVFMLPNHVIPVNFNITYQCYLKLLDQSYQAYDVGPNDDPTRRPQQGTTFVGQISGPVPP